MVAEKGHFLFMASLCPYWGTIVLSANTLHSYLMGLCMDCMDRIFSEPGSVGSRPLINLPVLSHCQITGGTQMRKMPPSLNTCGRWRSSKQRAARATQSTTGPLSSNVGATSHLSFSHTTTALFCKSMSSSSHLAILVRGRRIILITLSTVG